MKIFNTNIINILTLQIGWWSITLSYPQSLIYIPIVFALLAIHLYLTKDKLKETLFIFKGLIVGCSFDLLAINLGLWAPTDSFNFFPIWLFCYWLIFLTSFSKSLHWLKNKTALTGLLGFIFGPLSYYAGEKFSILKFESINDLDVIWSLAVYGLLWALSFVLLFKIHKIVKD